MLRQGSDKPADAQVPRRETRIFISYSRKDSDFAERLRDDLAEREFEAYLDKHDIRPGEPWQERLSGLITRADVVIFCLSPNSVTSEICDWEVNEAERIGKRLLPVVIAETDPEKTPGRLKRLNYVFMRNVGEYTYGLEELQSAIRTNILWIHEHTRLTERTSEWVASGKPDVALLRGDHIGDAEKWITERPSEAPYITEDVGRFIATSRKVENALQKRERLRNRTITGGSVAGMLIMGWLGSLMYNQWHDSMVRESLVLADHASEAARQGDLNTATLLALEALPDQSAKSLLRLWRPYVSTARLALEQSLGGGQFRDQMTFRQKGVVRGLKFCPKRNCLVTYSFDSRNTWAGSLKLWNTDSWTLTNEFDYEPISQDISFSADGSRFAVPDIDTKIINSSTGNIILTTNKVSWGRILPDGQFIFGRDLEQDHIIKVIAIDTEEELWRDEDFNVGWKKLATSPDGRFVAAITRNNQAFIWESDTGKRFSKIEKLNAGKIKELKFSPKSKYIALANSKNTVQLLPMDGSGDVQELSGHMALPNTMRFSADGSLILTADTSTSPDAPHGVVQLWEVATGRKVFALPRAGEVVANAMFVPNGNAIVITYLNGLVEIRSLETSGVVGRFRSPQGVAFLSDVSPDGLRVVTGEGNGYFRVWSRDERDFEVYNSLLNVRDVFLSRDGERLYLSNNWFSDVTPEIHSWLIGRDELKYDKEIEGKSLGVVRFWKAKQQFVSASFNNRNIDIWNKDFTKIIRTIETEGKGLIAIEIVEGENSIIVGLRDGGLQKIDLASGKLLKTVETGAEVNHILHLGNGRLAIALDRSRNIEIFNVHSLERVVSIVAHEHEIKDLARGPYGRRFASAAKDKDIKIWSVDALEVISVLQGHVHAVNDVVFSSDGKYIASASSDGTLRIWDSKTYQVLKSYCCHGSDVVRVLFDLRRGKVLSFSQDETFRRWPLPLEYDDLLDKAIAKVSRCLSTEQRLHFRMPSVEPHWCRQID